LTGVAPISVQLDSEHKIKAALADLRSLLVVPLLQYALFAQDVE
jgi:hypothetical protein